MQRKFETFPMLLIEIINDKLSSICQVTLQELECVAFYPICIQCFRRILRENVSNAF